MSAHAVALALIRHCIAARLKITAAESCTGGMIAACITDIPGASAAFECSFVTYANHAKETMLGVSAALLAAHGAVSPEVASAMAQGALTYAQADIAVAVTGIAGPGGETPGKPVGLVYIAVATAAQIQCQHYHLPGNRAEVRQAATLQALTLLHDTACHLRPAMA